MYKRQVQDTGTSDVMYYAFDTTDETNAAMESFLADYTENVNPEPVSYTHLDVYKRQSAISCGNATDAPVKPPTLPAAVATIPLHTSKTFTNKSIP